MGSGRKRNLFPYLLSITYGWKLIKIPEPSPTDWRVEIEQYFKRDLAANCMPSSRGYLLLAASMVRPTEPPVE